MKKLACFDYLMNDTLSESSIFPDSLGAIGDRRTTSRRPYSTTTNQNVLYKSVHILHENPIPGKVRMSDQLKYTSVA